MLVDDIITNSSIFSIRHLGQKPIKKVIKKKYLNGFSKLSTKKIKNLAVLAANPMTKTIKYGNNYRLSDLFSITEELNRNFLYVCILWQSLKKQKRRYHSAVTLIDAHGKTRIWTRQPMEKPGTRIKKGDFIFGMIEMPYWHFSQSKFLGLRMVVPGKAALKVVGGECDEWNSRLLVPLSDIRSKNIESPGNIKKQEAPGPVPLITPPTEKNKYKLITTLYNEQNPRRIKEYIKCLKANHSHQLIDEIHIFYDTDKDNPGPKSGLLKYLEKKPAIEKVYIKGRPTYETIFNYANAKFPDSRIIVCNADIYLNETLVLLNDVDLENTLLVLSRWDMVSGKKGRLIHDQFGDFNYMSADAWIFKTPLDINFTCDYQLGTIFCDSFLNTQLFKSGMKVYNPCFDVQACHLHKDWEEVKLEKSDDYTNEHQLKVWRAERKRTGPKPGVGVYWCKVDDLKKEPKGPYFWEQAAKEKNILYIGKHSEAAGAGGTNGNKKS